jgi:two-component system, cell cycle sensor histidine kinase and response regulator CckA
MPHLPLHGELTAVADRVVSTVLRLFRTRRVLLYLQIRGSKDLLCVAAAGADDPHEWLGQRIPIGAGVAGRAFSGKRAVWLPDVLADPSIGLPNWTRRRLEVDGFRSVAAVPMVVEGETLGTLTASDVLGRVFTDEDLDTLGAFVNQAALALRVVRLYEEAERSRDALALSEASFRLLFDHNPLPMWVYDAETFRFLEVNAAAIAHYGYSRDEFLQMRIVDIRPAEHVERLYEAIKDLATRDLRRAGVWRHRVKDGRLIDVEVISHRLEFHGRPAALVVVEDVTERRTLEQQVRQLQKMEAVGQLAGGIAHDFNNLLTVVTGRCALLTDRLPPDHPGRRDVDIIHKTTERAARLTAQLLAFSRKQVLQPKVLDLNELMSGMAPMLQRLIGEDIELAFMPGLDLGRVNADQGQLEQVVLNLVVNARDAMPRGGRLTIESANVELDETYARAHVGAQPGPYVMLAVSDTGCGMDAATQARVFEPFFTTKAPGKGTGLGLATVYGIVKQSGGNVWVYSELGRGTTFKIYLPSVEAATEGSEPGAAAPEAVRGTETVLLVEDEEELRTLGREVLQGYGYTVLLAHDAPDALVIAERYLGPIQLMVTDVVMPKMSGRDLARALAPSRPEMKVLYASGYTDSAIVRHGVLDAGIDFIQKPFTPDALGRKVREVLDTN